MLTRSMFTSRGLRVADMELDPSAIARSAGNLATSAGNLATHDLPELVRRVDVPRRLESGMDAASEAIRTAAEQLPGRQRRSPWSGWVPGVAIVSVLAVLAIAGWIMTRGAALSTARDIELELDADAVDRATDEGMPSADPTIAASDGMNLDGTAAAPEPFHP